MSLFMCVTNTKMLIPGWAEATPSCTFALPRFCIWAHGLRIGPFCFSLHWIDIGTHIPDTPGDAGTGETAPCCTARAGSRTAPSRLW